MASHKPLRGMLHKMKMEVQNIIATAISKKYKPLNWLFIAPVMIFEAKKLEELCSCKGRRE